jgi:hypothetical protein
MCDIWATAELFAGHNMTKELANIDEGLRFALFGLECALGVEFSVREVERVFRDVRNDQVARREYRFFDGNHLRVTGVVEEYEPESIWLDVEGGALDQRGLAELLERAKNQAIRMRKAANTP